MTNYVCLYYKPLMLQIEQYLHYICICEPTRTIKVTSVHFYVYKGVNWTSKVFNTLLQPFKLIVQIAKYRVHPWFQRMPLCAIESMKCIHANDNCSYFGGQISWFTFLFIRRLHTTVLKNFSWQFFFNYSQRYFQNSTKKKSLCEVSDQLFEPCATV